MLVVTQQLAALASTPTPPVLVVQIFQSCSVYKQFVRVAERTNSADDDAWTGETTLEYVCTKVTEQVSFASVFGGKRKADAPRAQQGTKAQKSAQMFTCTVCEVRKTNHASKICLICATAAKKAPAAAAPAAAVAPAAAAAAPVAGP